MEHVTLLLLNPVPDHWKVGDLLTLSFPEKSKFRILKINGTNEVIVRRWMWYDHIAADYYTVKKFFQSVGSSPATPPIIYLGIVLLYSFIVYSSMGVI